ncbi:MAG: hypothetical protein JSU96_03645 [Acidobacteriota bacterium]|nr:MAG: hypothetical protein JSU96_03645 [Acidobacteriota bacterium]
MNPNREEAVGQTLGRYKLLEKLGEGGCGAVYVAELGRAEEARRDLAQLKLALGDKPGHDRGDEWVLVDQAEIHQREAKALFQAKGIPLPEPEAK